MRGDELSMTYFSQPRKAIPRGEGLGHPEPRCGSIATNEVGVDGFIKGVRVRLRHLDNGSRHLRSTCSVEGLLGKIY